MIYLIILTLAVLCRVFVYRRAFALAAVTFLLAFIMCDHSVVTPVLNHINHDLPAFRVSYHHAFNAKVVRSYKGKGGHLTDPQLEALLADWAPADKESTEAAYLELRCFLALNIDKMKTPQQAASGCFKGNPKITTLIMQGRHGLKYTPYVAPPAEISWFTRGVQTYNAWKKRRVAACEKERRQIRAYQTCMEAWRDGRHQGSHRGLHDYCRQKAAKVE